jgi:acid phosphatase type 7
LPVSGVKSQRKEGAHEETTNPAQSNHEYAISPASGYFDYFGAAAGEWDKGYYSYDLGEWHIISLNSMCEKVGGCGDTSPTVSWLKDDLAANASHKCTLAYFHNPLFSSGNTATRPR